MAYPIAGGYHHRRRTIIVPPTTDMALVFPFDHENKRFDKSFYSHFLTDGRASSEQIEHFLMEAEEAVKQKHKWLGRFKAYLIFSFVTGFFIMTMYSLLTLSEVDDDNYDNTQYQANNNSHNKKFRHHNNRSHEFTIEERLDVMVFGWLFLIFTAVVWGAIFRCFKKHSMKKAKKSVQEVVDRHSSIFANAGLRWNIPLAFPHYIELWKDYKGQNYMQANNQIVHMQANNQIANKNPLSFHQIQHQLQNQNQNQRYPTLPPNQVMDQRPTYLDFQNNGVSSPLLNNLPQGREINNYVPPYPTHYVTHTHTQ